MVISWLPVTEKESDEGGKEFTIGQRHPGIENSEAGITSGVYPICIVE